MNKNLQLAVESKNLKNRKTEIHVTIKSLKQTKKLNRQVFIH